MVAGFQTRVDASDDLGVHMNRWTPMRVLTEAAGYGRNSQLTGLAWH